MAMARGVVTCNDGHLHRLWIGADDGTVFLYASLDPFEPVWATDADPAGRSAFLWAWYLLTRPRKTERRIDEAIRRVHRRMRKRQTVMGDLGKYRDEVKPT